MNSSSQITSAEGGTNHAANPSAQGLRTLVGLAPYLVAGIFFGFVAIKAEIISWYRIQEMFRFQSFHMYGLIGSAVLVAALSVWLIKRLEVRTIGGEEITFTPKDPGWRRYLMGGTVFGIGWALVGACPGPIFALIGAGIPAMLVVFVGALLGTYLYGVLRSRLPH